MQRGDALALLRLLLEAYTPLVFFDPQHRAVLDKLKFGNEGARQKGRAGLPAMSDERVDVLAIGTWMTTHQPQHAVIERAQAMPKQGGSSGFKCGRAVGAIEAVIACCGIPLTIVEPSTCKKFHQLR